MRCIILHLLFSFLLLPFSNFSQGLQVFNDSLSYPGYTLFPQNEKAYLIDNCGTLINDWTFDNEAALCTYLMPNGNIFWMGNLQPSTFAQGGANSGNMEIRDENNNLVWSYTYYTPNEFGSHHDCEVMPNGNILLLVWENISLIDAITLGRDPAFLGSQFWTTKIVEIEPVGTNQANIVWEWSVKDHLVQDVNSNISNFGVIADNPQLIDINLVTDNNSDWLHANGIDYNETLDQILISIRDLSEVIIIDHSTTTTEAATHAGGTYGKGGDILYRWGNPQNYGRGTSADKILVDQHDARWIRNGYPNAGGISVFNNRGVSNILSSADVFFPPTDALGFYTAPADSISAYSPDSLLSSFTNGPSGNFFTAIQGAAQVLPNGNMLICNSTTQDMFEVTNAGELVWHYNVPIPPSYGMTSNNFGNVFKMTHYLIGDPELENLDLTPGLTIEMPASAASASCDSIAYPTFCAVNYEGFSKLYGTETGIADYETAGILESIQIIDSTAVIDYDSGTEVILLPGFETIIGADFYAIIDGCNEGGGGLN